MRRDRGTPGGQPTGAAPRTAAEWVSLSIALLVLAGVVGAVVALWLSPREAPPRFAVEVGAVRRDGDRYYLTVTVRNEGDVTASEVLVVGVLDGSGGEETASTTFDFIPGRSAVEAVLVFARDPTTASVQVHSFQKP